MVQSQNRYLVKDEPVVNNETKDIKKILNPIPFTGDKEVQYCQLCNKLIKEGHIIITCPVCNAIFHYDHLFDWLRDNTHCPICKTDF
ncbi:MAG TPA: hypothetical protein VMZ29_17495 [Candidatus Bathyarchaeia archaeon]|nr:hypothetical protein [Candidatus Bathyarchaeia archaeon]